ncbi:MAG TPA: hypothetical protein VKG44_08545, partial [Candidatus Baltobacteraceae bacterium]|nr:hypothetical protein [Candidatus Baltobacteraceae bacterium]
FPAVILAPLLMAVVQVLVLKLLSLPDVGGGSLANATGGIVGFILQLLNSFALCVSLIVADHAWRSGRAPFDQAWDEARHKAPDILFAAIGFAFILWAAQTVGGFVSGFGAPILAAVALFFFIYTLPAAAIGGVPGGAALQASLDRARGAVPATLFVTITYVLAYIVVPLLATTVLLPLMLLTSYQLSSTVASLIAALIQAVAAGYVALVLAKTYNDVSYGRRY